MSLLMDFEIKKVLRFREKNKSLVDSLYEATFSEKFTEKNLYNKTKTELYTFVKNVEIKLSELQSGIDINNLALSIHKGNSRAISSQAFSKRVCVKCGEEYTISNGSNSMFCLKCATELATSIVLDYKNFMKK